MKVQKLLSATALLCMAGSLMGNSSCSSTPAAPPRVFARKVQVGAVTAPNIVLPAAYGGVFNFGSVANTQMEAILGSTPYFSIANVNPNGNYSPSGLSQATTDAFNVCTPSTPPNQVAPGGNPLPVGSGGSNGVQSGSAPTSGSSNISQSYYGSCLIDVPQALISTSINDFALEGGGGVTLTTSNLSILGGASFSFSTYSLQVEMLAKNPLDIGGSTESALIQNTYTTNLNAALTLNLGPFAIGPSGYFQTPIAQVTQTGLTSATTDLYNNWSAKDPWYAMVLKSCGDYIYINGSSDLGLQIGDVLEVKNVMNMWYGDVCNSQWAGDVPDVTPVAYVQVVSLGDNMAAAQLIKGNSAYPLANSTIYPGARVYMYQQSQTLVGVTGLPATAQGF